MLRIIKRKSEIDIYSPYLPEFVNELKKIVPEPMRSWNKPCWTVSSKYEDAVVGLMIAMYAEMPSIYTGKEKEREEVTFQADYIGRCRFNPLEESTANVYCNGKWERKIRESALRKFFESNQKNGHNLEPTLYATLGVPHNVTTEEIKKAFRRMSRQWHPDVCREPNAHEMFIKINEANSVLSNPMSRRKYDFALEVSETAVDARLDLGDEIKKMRDDQYGFQSPLRCGIIKAEGIVHLGRFTVDNILSWEDIIDDRGRYMVSSWINGAKMPTIFWV